MIPVEKDSQYYPKDGRPHSLPPKSSNNVTHMQTENGQSITNNSQSMDSVVLSPEEENKKDIDAFLDKIDSNLAETKKFVEKSQNSFE